MKIIIDEDRCIVLDTNRSVRDITPKRTKNGGRVIADGKDLMEKYEMDAIKRFADISNSPENILYSLDLPSFGKYEICREAYDFSAKRNGETISSWSKAENLIIAIMRDVIGRMEKSYNLCDVDEVFKKIYATMVKKGVVS